MKNKIVELAYLFKFPFLKANLEYLLNTANEKKMSYEAFLLFVLEKEKENRAHNSIERRLKLGRFTERYYLEDFDFSVYEEPVKSSLEEISKLNFITCRENVVLFGCSGSGKSHFSIAVGIKAIVQGYNVLFISVQNLMTEIREAMTDDKLTSYKKKFLNYDLVIIDELHNTVHHKDEIGLLFNLLNDRNQSRSTIINTNIPFNEWEKIFVDPYLTKALIDRLSYKSYVVPMNVDVSYRVKETIEYFEKKKNKPTEEN